MPVIIADRDSIEFIVQFAERFPDVTDYEVLLAYSEYTRGSPVEFDSLKARIILHAYNHKNVDLTADYARLVYGVVIK